jgi:hypothetical protein
MQLLFVMSEMSKNLTLNLLKTEKLNAVVGACYEEKRV